MNKKTLICLAIIIGGYLSFKLLHLAFRDPANTIRGADLGDLISIQGCPQTTSSNLDEFQPKWNITRFRLASLEQSPAKTPTCTIQLETSTGNYPGYFDAQQGLLFLSFLPRYKHGWFTEPEDNTWPRPLYLVEASPKWLSLIGFSAITSSPEQTTR